MFVGVPTGMALFCNHDPIAENASQLFSKVVDLYGLDGQVHPSVPAAVAEIDTILMCAAA
ncbi:MAG: hypothetical protein IPJ18_20290 [Betaproteobacteria bacterium]|nr:hypothetical protein [Betaproteobacteria bacterium]